MVQVQKLFENGELLNLESISFDHDEIFGDILRIVGEIEKLESDTKSIKVHVFESNFFSTEHVVYNYVFNDPSINVTKIYLELREVFC